MVEDFGGFGEGNAITFGEALLDGDDAFPDADGGFGTARFGDAVLEVAGGSEVVRVDVGVEDPDDRVVVLSSEGEEGVSGGGGEGVGGGIEVEYRVDDDGGFGDGVSYDVLPGGGLGFEDGVDDGFKGRHDGCLKGVDIASVVSMK